MTERYWEAGRWARSVLLPAPSTAVAIVMLLGLWWGGQQWMIAPQWRRVSRQIEQAYAQRQHAEHVADAVHRLSTVGHLVRVTEAPLLQACRDQATRRGIDLVALQWHAHEGRLDVSLRGDSTSLLGWWDDVGRSVLLGSVQRWQWQALPKEEGGEERASRRYQLDVTLLPELWHWEALSS
ncbi:hypothetical protein [Zymobacter palmae]|uniref:Uncharacterized protein n=1 Tax=Zymobacter palmae TaxID=33074 RepID=A0A348HD55_9GAMM|nr:hypothetical protein [Zymobacter palmae]BBG29557.1 hypothetical protein ZBT109_0781 [Zymobacter palmae]